jgi:hypothetical protein
MDLLTSSLALDVFVPGSWLGINMPPYHLKIKPSLPDHIKAHTRPVREALYQDAKKEFDRMRTYFDVPSNSPIASPLVVAPKATAPFIHHCGDYRQINPYIQISQKPIPHVQQSIAKAARWKIFVDLDMTNSFHQIPIDKPSSELLSVSTPWVGSLPSSLPARRCWSSIRYPTIRCPYCLRRLRIVDHSHLRQLPHSCFRLRDATAKLELVLLRCQNLDLYSS